MAPLVGDATAMLRARWSELVARTPGRAELALRLAVICALTTWVAQACETPDAALCAYVVFFMNKPDRTSSVLTCAVFILLISILIGLLMLIAGVALDVPSWRVAIMAALSLLLLFLASASKLKPLASTIALILIYALDMLGKVPEGELATRALLYVVMMIGIPAGVSIVVNLLIGPTPRRLAERALVLRLRAAQALLLVSDAAARQRIATLRGEGDASTQNYLRMALLEKTSSVADLLALKQAAHSAEVLLMLAEEIDRARDLPIAWRKTAAAALDDMAAMLERHRYPLDIEPVSTGRTPLSGATLLLIADFNATLANFAVIPPESAKASARTKGHFFVPDAFTHPEHIRYAIKATMAAMVCYLFYSLSDWPGIHTCLLTCYIVALDTTAETVEKLSLRITGALVGAAVGLAAIVWLTPSIDHIGGLLVLVFAGGLAGGWIAAGSPRIAYAGYQVTFAIFLCVIQGSTPAFDLTVARDRVIGILLGNAVVYLIFVSVWPVSMARRIDPGITALLRQLGSIARLVTRADRLNALPQVHTAIPKIDTDLEVVCYEPSSLRPPVDWFLRRKAVLAAIPSLECTLLCTDERMTLDALAIRLERMASAVERGDSPELQEPPDVGIRHKLEQNRAH